MSSIGGAVGIRSESLDLESPCVRSIILLRSTARRTRSEKRFWCAGGSTGSFHDDVVSPVKLHVLHAKYARFAGATGKKVV